MKESKRMAVPSQVPSIIPVLKLLILTQNPWRFKHGIHFSGNAVPGGIYNRKYNARALGLLERPWDGWPSALLLNF